MTLMCIRACRLSDGTVDNDLIRKLIGEKKYLSRRRGEKQVENIHFHTFYLRHRFVSNSNARLHPQTSIVISLGCAAKLMIVP